MNADGTGQTRLTNNTAVDAWPCLLARLAQKIAFTSLRDGGGNFEIYSMNADGTDQTRLTTDPGYDMIPQLLARRTEDRLLHDPRRQLRDLLDERRRHGQTRLTNNAGLRHLPGLLAGRRPRSPSTRTATATTRST